MTVLETFSRAVITVEASCLPASQRGRAQQLADVYAWCGEGELTPNQVHSLLRPDSFAARPRAHGFLLRTERGRRYLATACHVLSEPSAAAPQALIGFDPSSSALTGGSEDGESSGPVRGLTELAFNDAVFRTPGHQAWYPALSFPHLDLALIRVDENEGLCSALEEAGFAFMESSRIGDEPTGEGAWIDVLGFHSADTEPPAGKASTHPQTIKARVSGLQTGLSFFWTDSELPATFSAAPAIERGTVVGFVSPQVGSGEAVDRSPALHSWYATVTKASFLKRLLEADEEDSGGGESCRIP